MIQTDPLPLSTTACKVEIASLKAICFRNACAQAPCGTPQTDGPRPLQHAPPLAGARPAVRGDVLLRDGRHAILWRQDAAHPHRLVILLPIRRHNIPRHRGDVLIDDLADMLALGCGGRDMMIRCAHPVVWAPCELGVRVGTVPPLLMAQLVVACDRARQAAGYEVAHAVPDDERDAWR